MTPLLTVTVLVLLAVLVMLPSFRIRANLLITLGPRAFGSRNGFRFISRSLKFLMRINGLREGRTIRNNSETREQVTEFRRRMVDPTASSMPPSKTIQEPAISPPIDANGRFQKVSVWIREPDTVSREALLP